MSKVPVHYYSYSSVNTYNTRNTNNIPLLKVKHNFFQYSFFPSVVIEWNKLYQSIRNLQTLKIFKKTLLKFIRDSVNNIFNYRNSKGVKLLTRLRVDLSLRCERNFKQSQQSGIGVFIVNFDHISHLLLVFQLLTLNK